MDDAHDFDAIVRSPKNDQIPADRKYQQACTQLRAWRAESPMTR